MGQGAKTVCAITQNLDAKHVGACAVITRRVGGVVCGEAFHWQCFPATLLDQWEIPRPVRASSNLGCPLIRYAWHVGIIVTGVAAEATHGNRAPHDLFRASNATSGSFGVIGTRLDGSTVSGRRSSASGGRHHPRLVDGVGTVPVYSRATAPYLTARGARSMQNSVRRPCDARKLPAVCAERNRTRVTTWHATVLGAHPAERPNPCESHRSLCPLAHSTPLRILCACISPTSEIRPIGVSSNQVAV